jgi:hypothetical protein
MWEGRVSLELESLHLEKVDLLELGWMERSEMRMNWIMVSGLEEEVRVEETLVGGGSEMNVTWFPLWLFVVETPEPAEKRVCLEPWSWLALLRPSYQYQK